MLRVGGIVLCGGKSQRMGKPKAWLPFAGELMLPRVVRLLAEAVDPVVVLAARDQAVPPLPAHIDIIRDEQADRGPLEGLRVGLRALSARCDAAYLSSCDVPFLSPAIVRRLIQLLGDHAICVPRAGEYYHPLAAVYRTSVLEVVEELLKENQFGPRSLLDRVSTRVADANELADVDPGLQSLRNLNTIEDYEAACGAGL